MYIKEIDIKNFRGLTSKFVDLKKSFLIIGKNDSGKTNFCYAIRKVLDYNIRKQPMVESDSTNSNKEDILIKITFNLEGISTNNRANLKEYIDSVDEENESLTIELTAKFNEDTQAYDESITFGTLDKTNPKSAANGNELDKVLDFIYVYPNYDLVRDTKNYFTYHKSENNKNNVPTGKEIIEGIENLNNRISSNSAIKKMQDELNDLVLVKEMIGDISFGIKSDFDISNIYRSLKIFPITNDKVVSIGDGKSKTLALLLQKLTKNENKEKIIILEEPENHLFPLLQKQYAGLIDNFVFGQTIITTHSPSIIDFRKMEEIFKFKIEKETTDFNFHRINTNEKEIYKNFGYSLNEEIAESFFYDEVLLIEGYSEKLFYNMLVNNDDDFRKKVLDRGLGFVCVYGVDFTPSKKILESLGIKVHLLTDNDFYKIGNNENIKRYAGIQLAWEMLKESEKEEMNAALGHEISKDTFKVEVNSKEHNFVKEIIENLINKFRDFNIYIHHNHENGFEEAFVNFIGDDDRNKEDIIKFLKNKKMKNLHNYITENQINISVNEQNKKNILVGFIYE